MTPLGSLFLLALIGSARGEKPASSLRSIQQSRELTFETSSLTPPEVAGPFLKYVGQSSASTPVATPVTTPVTPVVDTPGDRMLTVIQSQVTVLQLMNADTDQVVTELEDGMVISLDAIPNMTTPSFNINALFNGTEIGSVRYGYNTRTSYRTELAAPYAFCGNARTDFFSCSRLGLGTHTVTATPRTRQGKWGRPVKVTFTIVEADVVPPTLVNFVALSPTTVDVTTAEAEILIQITVQDEASGIDLGLLGFKFDFDFLRNFYYLFREDPDFFSTPSIGLTNNDPVTFNVSMRIPRFLPNGTEPLQVNFGDDAGNVDLNNPTTLQARGFVHNITILNSGPVDTTNATLVSVKILSNSTVTRNSTVIVEIVASDDLSGFSFGYLEAILTNSSDYVSLYAEFGKPGIDPIGGSGFLTNTPDLAGGNVPHTFQVSWTIAADWPVGVYELDVGLVDGVKNWIGFNATTLARLGFPNNITVV